MNQKEKNNQLRKSKGITLIALVVTIIVLIILAGISINLVLGENGIITRAREASKAQEIAQIKEEVQLDIVAKEAEKLSKGESITQSEIEAILSPKYGTVNKNDDGTIKSLTPTDKDYEIPFEEIYGGKISTDGPTVPTTVEEAKADYVEGKTPVLDSKNNTVVIPNGFKVSENSGASIEEGIVVEDKKGNEFVWIPVPLAEGETFESKYPRTEFADNVPTTGLSTDYTEPYASGYDGEDDEYDLMIASVNANKGFYIGRYETGFNGEKAKGTYTSYETDPTQDQIKAETAKLVVVKDAYVYNYVPWGSEMNDITALNKGTADSPAYVIGAVELATNFDEVNGYSGVTSTLMYGIQWDMVMRYVADANHSVNNSSSWGNYSNSTGDAATNSGNSNMNYTAGRNEAWQAKKIYDLAGNIYEWTMEANSSNYRVRRGR